MKRIVLISCASKKGNYKTQAKNLYISTLFKFNLQYALSLKPDQIFILSAKYGLVDLEEEIEPYNQTLKKMSTFEIYNWAQKVLEKLKIKVDLKEDEIIFFAGEVYREYLIPHIVHYQIPLKGLGIGEQLGYLKRKLCELAD